MGACRKPACVKPLVRKKRKSGRSGTSGGSGESGKSGKSGRSFRSGTRTSGASGKSGRSGRSGYSLREQERCRQDLKAFVLASMVETLGKVQGSETKARALRQKVFQSNDVQEFRRDSRWSTHHRCEVSARLDFATLELLDHALPESWPCRLAFFWLLRTVFSGSGLLSACLVQYEHAAGTSLASHIKRQCVSEDLLIRIFSTLQLGQATPEARMQQFSALWGRGRGKFKLREFAAQIFVNLANHGHFHAVAKVVQRSTSAVEDIAKAVTTDLRVQNPFLCYLIIRDVSEFKDMPESDHVGPGAVKTLRKCAGSEGDDAAALRRLHEWLQGELPQEWIESTVGTRGWLLSDTEHVLCEKRRFENAKKVVRRARAAGSADRAALRRERLKRLWQLLRFRRLPGVCKVAQKYECMMFVTGVREKIWASNSMIDISPSFPM